MDNMDTFIAQRIINAADVSLESGQAKYRLYFVTMFVLYGQWKTAVDAILQMTYSAQYPEPDGYGVCIVTE